MREKCLWCVSVQPRLRKFFTWSTAVFYALFREIFCAFASFSEALFSKHMKVYENNTFLECLFQNVNIRRSKDVLKMSFRYVTKISSKSSVKGAPVFEYTLSEKKNVSIKIYNAKLYVFKKSKGLTLIILFCMYNFTLFVNKFIISRYNLILNLAHKIY